MTSHKSQQDLNQLHARINHLQAQVSMPGRERPDMDQMLEQLAESLEELQVAEEELQLQNEQLRTAQQQIEQEQQRYQELFDFAPDGYLVTDEYGSIREANRAAAAMLGVAPQRLTGKPLALYVEKADLPFFRHRVTQIPRSNEKQHWEIKMRPRGGRDSTAFDAELTVAPARAPDGKLVGIRWIVRDISARKQSELKLLESEQEIRALNAGLEQGVQERTAQLQESEERFRATFEQAGVGMAQVSLDGRYLRVNPRMCQMLGYTESELLQRTLWDLVHPADLAREEQVIKRLLRGDIDHHAWERRYIAKDGAVIWGHVTRSVLRDASGQTQSLITVVEDITRRKLAEAEMQRLSARLEEQAKMLDAIIAASPVYFYAFDRSCQIVYVSPDGAKLLGHTPEALIGKSMQEIGAPEDITDRMVANCRHVFETAETLRATETIPGPDGSHTYDYTLSPILGADGAVTIVVNTAQDITERMQSEAALRQALDRAKELYQISRLIGLVHTPHDVLRALILSEHLQRVHRAAILLFDSPWLDSPPGCCRVLASWRGDAVLPSIEGEEFAFETYGFGQLLARDQPVHIEEVQADPRLNDEARKLFQRINTYGVTIFPLIAAGQWYGVLTLHTSAPRSVSNEDLRHVRGLVDQAAVAIYNIGLLEAEAEARREAEKANELKLKFLAMISHELRTPLTSIKGFATTLMARDVTWDDESQRDFIATISEEADKLTDLIEQLLDLSRLDAGLLRIRPTQHSLNDILDQAIAQVHAITANHQLEIHAPTDLPPVLADATRTAQVLTNLVDNAAKYSPQHSEIRITTALLDGFVQVNVSDQGIGISLEERPYVFEAFRRGEGDGTKRTKGAGLGLAICKGLIEAQGGRIWVQVQEPDKTGTTVSFTLPVASEA